MHAPPLHVPAVGREDGVDRIRRHVRLRRDDLQDGIDATIGVADPDQRARNACRAWSVTRTWVVPATAPPVAFARSSSTYCWNSVNPVPSGRTSVHTSLSPTSAGDPWPPPPESGAKATVVPNLSLIDMHLPLGQPDDRHGVSSVDSF